MVQSKKLDSRIHKIIQESVKSGHRGLFAVVGERARDQVVILHHLLSKATIAARPNVLWCYKKDLGFTTHKKKRMKMIKKKIKAGTLDPNKDDTFEMFISATEIRYLYYNESHNILGNTYGMCVLQDFEAVTPNVLARTIETVQGGGLVVMVLNSVSDVKQLYDLQMDCHDRFKTSAYHTVVPRFNKRFLLSLTDCSNCLVLTDNLEVLPFSSKSVNPPTNLRQSQHEELGKLKDTLADTQPVGSVVGLCKTLDQANALVKFVDVISEKALRSTITLTASRGRGKSAALGLAMATSIAFGYSNIFVTSPSPDNLKTLFEFVMKGFDVLGFQEHTDYEIIQSTENNVKSVVRVNVYRDHRQTIQYIKPDEAGKLLQAELLVIDEAGAIPLHLVKQMFGPYLVLLSSTVHGYEGTGRSLSIKLFDELRTQSQKLGGKALSELKLEEPIRYKDGDPVEAWLNKLLCLDASPRIISGCPIPADCSLYFVNKDVLFSYHKASEAFLHRIMTLYVSSHYKNSPNDLQLLSDAPAHQLLVLLGPIDPESASLPEVLCVVQVCFEGQINKAIVMAELEKGHRSAGDLIPWTLCQQFQDPNFGELSGVRVVRIATHPDFQSMGYGKHAINLLSEYYQGKIATSESKDDQTLLVSLNERTPESIDYIGVSYGITPQLLRFWKRQKFQSVYLRQTPNDITGEHTCIMVQSWGQSWLNEYHSDFSCRLLNLLGYEFRKLPPQMVLNLVNSSGVLNTAPAGSESWSGAVSKYDFRRLKSYTDNLTDYHIILDLVPTITKLYFGGKINLNLSPLQSSILISLGLQYRSVDQTSTLYPELETSQIMGIFKKIMKKTVTHMEETWKTEISSEMITPASKVPNGAPLSTLAEELNKAEEEFKAKEKENREKVKDLIGHDDEFAIKMDDRDVGDVALSGNTIISVKRTVKVNGDAMLEEEGTGKKKKRKSEGGLFQFFSFSFNIARKFHVLTRSFLYAFSGRRMECDYTASVVSISEECVLEEEDVVLEEQEIDGEEDDFSMRISQGSNYPSKFSLLNLSSDEFDSSATLEITNCSTLDATIDDQGETKDQEEDKMEERTEERYEDKVEERTEEDGNVFSPASCSSFGDFQGDEEDKEDASDCSADSFGEFDCVAGPPPPSDTPAPGELMGQCYGSLTPANYFVLHSSPKKILDNNFIWSQNVIEDWQSDISSTSSSAAPNNNNAPDKGCCSPLAKAGSAEGIASSSPTAFDTDHATRGLSRLTMEENVLYFVLYFHVISHPELRVTGSKSAYQSYQLP
eukprot:sb/3461117/